MTREEHIYQLKLYLKGLSKCMVPASSLYWKEHYEEIIEALEQEPTTKNDLGVDAISRAEMLKYQEYLHGKMSNEENHKLWKFIKNLPSVTPQEPILDKIRAEIAEIPKKYPMTMDYENGLKEALGIIDKYKAETEVKDGDDSN